jgi:hypothetical protein
LLRYNSSNQVFPVSSLVLMQNYFRETRGVPRLVGIFPSGDNAGHWPSQRAGNTILSLAVTRILISKGGAGTTSNQVSPISRNKNNRKEALAQSGALNKMINLALSFDPPSTISAAVPPLNLQTKLIIRPCLHVQTSSAETIRSKPTSQPISSHSVPSTLLRKSPEPPHPLATNDPPPNPNNRKSSSSTPSSEWH